MFVVFGIVALTSSTPTSSRRSTRRWSSSRCPIPARRPTSSSARWSIRSKRPSPASAASTACARARWTASQHHRRVRLRQGPAGRHAGDPRQDLGIRNDLPTEMEEPILTQFDPADRPIVSLTLSSPGLTGAELTGIADPGHHPPAARHFRRGDVNLVGPSSASWWWRSARATCRRPASASARWCGRCRRRTWPSPVGRLEGALDERTIRLKGRLERRPTSSSWWCRRRTAAWCGSATWPTSGIPRKSRARTRVQRRRGRRHRHPEVHRVQHHGRGRRVRAQVAEIQRDAAGRRDAARGAATAACGRRTRSAASRKRCIEGAALTVAVVFLFLNSWRSTVITGLALPVSVLASFVAVWAFGFTLNTMSLLGLSLAIGILIDDAIVVRENIVRHVEMGKSHLKAATRAPTRSAWRSPPRRSRSSWCSSRSRSSAAWRGSGSSRSA